MRSTWSMGVATGRQPHHSQIVTRRAVTLQKADPREDVVLDQKAGDQVPHGDRRTVFHGRNRDRSRRAQAFRDREGRVSSLEGDAQVGSRNVRRQRLVRRGGVESDESARTGKALERLSALSVAQHMES